MSYYIKEFSQHKRPKKIGILLVNLGTPSAPFYHGIRNFLKQFLSDRRVVELPRFLWKMILHLWILNMRPQKVAGKYQLIWSETDKTINGSPLMRNSLAQLQALRENYALCHNRPPEIALGMTYGKPDITTELFNLKKAGCDRILIFPLFPQYAASSTGAAFDKIWHTLLRTRNVPSVRTIKHYHDHPLYINAITMRIKSYWQKYGKPEKLIISFHGIPKKQVQEGDPYACECRKTARLIASTLNLDEEDFVLAFQSRFGPATWTKPYLKDVLQELGEKKVRRVDIICPGFLNDCLETLEEIKVENAWFFKMHGGGDYHYIPALNDAAYWIDAMKGIIDKEIINWN